MRQHSAGDGRVSQHRPWLDALGRGDEHRGGLSPLCRAAVVGVSPDRDRTGKLNDPDYSGTPVVLGRATWHAKAGNAEVGDHPEIRDYLEDVRATIESPTLVFQSRRDERSRIFYRLGAGRGEFAGKHMVVVVKYVQEAGLADAAMLGRCI